jgi:type IV pilus assembly protein PilY1
MKSLLQFTTSLAALGTLLAGTVQAASIADLPLKTSVLAKPNVIFGMDDSGSMDWEILLDTASGILYWNGATSWNTATNKPLAIDNNFVPYPYVLPVGTAVGGAIYPFNSWYGQAVPPINQFAWVRSSTFNPIYYNTLTTYPAWSPAYFGGSLKNYGNVSVTAAPSHPAVTGTPTLNVSANWSSANGNFTMDGYRFYVQAGMTLPAGTRVNSTGTGAGNSPCWGWGEVTTTAAQTVPNGAACWASIPYYPATFWHPEVCTLGNDCVNAPDGSGTLRRYEIRNTGGTYPSNRSYTDEMQNFANWFSYYRKRKLMLAGSMGRVMEGISGLRLGVMAFNENPTLTMFDADAASSANNRFAAAGAFYLNSMSALGTPTHQNVKNIANQFATNTNVVQYACQRNNMFIVTDGFSNTTTTSVPAYDTAKFGGTAPYTVTPTGSLADLALAYYTNRLRPDLPAGKLPPSTSTEPNADKNIDLHINTYAITLGVRGSLWPNTVDPFVTAPVWPTPVADTPSMIDDQWHATINGRGRMYLATTPEETAANIRAGLEDMLSQKSSQGGAAVSSVNLARGDSGAYVATYDPAGWSGDIEARSIDKDTGAISTSTSWRAAPLLDARDWTTRVFATYTAGAGAAFTAATAGTTVNPSNAYGVTADVINYLKGDRSKEGTSFRKRNSLLGAVLNAEPVVDRDTGVLYAVTGEGMLHAFDTTVGADAGKELWAYVPGLALPNIGKTVQRSYSFRTQLDGTPLIANISPTNKLLIAGMGVAGRGYYAIDVTSPRGLNDTTLAGKVKWEFPAASDTTTKAKMGQTLGRPTVVRLSTGDHVVLVTSGYNNTLDGKGRLWVLNPNTGAIIKEYVTADGSLSVEAGLAHVSAFGESDGSVRFVYGGDLLGNVWRFDLNLAAGSTGSVNKIAQLRGPTGLAQAVTAAPELLSYAGKRIVYVGTGRLLDVTDFGNSAVQTMYAIADGTLLSNARLSLVQQVFTPGGSGALTSNPVNWATGRGWYMDLPAGEQVNTRPTMGYGALAFVANQAGASDCSASSRMYVIDVLTGSKFAGANFVVSTISTTSNASRVNLLLTRGGTPSTTEKQEIVGTACKYEDSTCKTEKITGGKAIPASKNSWREIRR